MLNVRTASPRALVGLSLAGLALVLIALAIMAHPAAAQTQLKFATPPSQVAAGVPFAPTVKVGVYDASNVLYTSSTYTVTLTLSSSTCPNTALPATKPCGRLLDGAAQGQQSAITANTVSGIATFPSLRIDAVGMSYQVQASASGLSSATSASFDVTAGDAWPQFHKGPARTAATSLGAQLGSPVSMGDLTVLAGTGRTITSTPLVLDLDRDGLLDIVAVTDFANTASGTSVVKALRQTSPGVFSTYWTFNGFAAFNDVKDGKAVIAGGDLNGDNFPEIVVYDTTITDGGAIASIGDHTIRVLSGTTGGVLYSWSPPGTMTVPITPVIGDVDGNGYNDVVFQYFSVAGSSSTGGNSLAVISGSTFALNTYLMPTVTSPDNGLGTCTGYPQFMEAPPALGEFRAAHDGLEIAIGTDHTHAIDACNGQPTMPVGRVYLCQFAGAITCPEFVNLPAALAGVNNDQAQLRAPEVKGIAAADLDGDGNLEIVVNAGHKDGQATQTKTLEVIRATPSLQVMSTRDDGYLWNTPALGDVDGDGLADIVNVHYSADSGDTSQSGDVQVRGYASGAIIDKGTLLRTAAGGAASLESQGGGALVNIDYVTGAVPRLEHVFGSEDNNPSTAFGGLTASTGGAAGPVNPTNAWALATSGLPVSPMALGDLTGDCRPETLVGMDTGNLARYKGADATVPGTPSLAGITGPPYASPGYGKQAKLFWSTPADGGLPILDYRVYRSTSSTGTYSEVGVWRGATSPVSGLEFVDDLTTPGYGDYYYKVSAVNCVGEGPKSASFYAEVQPGDAPTDMVGVVGDTTTPQHTVQLTWTASTANVARPNGCGPVDEYWVFRGTTSTFAPDLTSFTNRIAVISNGLAVPSTTFSYTDTSATIQTDDDYYYKIVANNCVGPGSSLDFWAEVKVALTPGTLTATANVATPSTALSWGASADNSATPNGCGAVLHYNLYRTLDQQAGTFGPTPLATITAPTTTYTDTTVALAHHYYYKVAAVNCVGEGPKTPSGNGVLADFKAPNTPTLSATAPTSTTISLSWTMPSPADPASDGAGVGILRYEVYWKVGPGVTISDTHLTPDPTGTSVTHTGRTVNVQYCYIVRAVDLNGNVGAPSPPQCATPPDQTPPATLTTLAAATFSATQVDASWTSPTDDVGVTGYELYWKQGPGVTLASTKVAPNPGAAAVAYSHVGLNPATQYCYRIRAYDAAGNMAALSNEACATTLSPSAQPPHFTLGAVPSSLEDAGTVSVPGFATLIAAGTPAPPTVGVQFFASVVSSNPSGLFATLPAVAPFAYAQGPWSGALTYEAAPDKCGTAQVDVYLKDNAGPAGRLDTSASQSFTITVTCVNDRPRFTPATVDISLSPFDGPQLFPGWATAIAPGPAAALDEATGATAQKMRFVTTVSNPGLFVTQPSVSPTALSLTPSGDLTFEPQPGHFGTSSVLVCLRDNGGTANGGVDLSSPCANLTVHVLGPPQAQPDCYTLRGSLTVAAPGVVGNDASNGGTPAAQLVSGPAHAHHFALHADGSFEYAPQPGFTGADSFAYRASAGPYRSDPVAVCLTILGTPAQAGPQADFSYAPTRALVGEPVSFVDMSLDPDGTIVSWSWDFTDNATAAGPVTTHTFDHEGTFHVELTVHDDSGALGVIRYPVEVGPAGPAVQAKAEAPKELPRADLPKVDDPAPPPQAPRTVLENFTVTADAAGEAAFAFAAKDAAASSYTWNFGDGKAGTGPVAAHAYTGPGDYRVRLTFQADGATHTSEQVVHVAAPATAARDTVQQPAGAQLADSASGVSTIALAAMGVVGAAVAAGLGAFLVVLRRKGKGAQGLAPPDP